MAAHGAVASTARAGAAVAAVGRGDLRATGGYRMCRTRAVEVAGCAPLLLPLRREPYVPTDLVAPAGAREGARDGWARLHGRSNRRRKATRDGWRR